MPRSKPLRARVDAFERVATDLATIAATSIADVHGVELDAINDGVDEVRHLVSARNRRPPRPRRPVATRVELPARRGRSGAACHAAAVDSSSLVVVAAVFLVYAALSRRLHGTSITAPMVFVVAGFVFGTEGLGWLHLTLDQDAVSTLAEATLVVVLFTDASRIDLRALRREYSVPARLLGIGLPLTIVVGTLAGGLVLRDGLVGRGGRARDRAGSDRRRAGPSRRHRREPAVAYPSGAERRERPQRRLVRAAARDRARRRADRCRRHHGEPRGEAGRSRRSAGASWAVSSPVWSRAASCGRRGPVAGSKRGGSRSFR